MPTNKTKKLAIIGAPSCFGGTVSGCQRGPRAIRKNLIPKLKKNKIQYKDYGDVAVPKLCVVKDARKKCIKEIKKIQSNLAKLLINKKVFQKNHLPVLLGGDHSLNYSFIKESARKQKGKLGLIWFDAHGDFNTPETSPSGNVHGMPLSALAGIGLTGKTGKSKTIIKEENICLFGVRDLDPLEKKLLRNSKVTVIPMSEIRKRGINKSLQKALKVVTKNTNGIHLSFDVDFMDPSIAPGTGTPVKGGFKKISLKKILKILQAQPIKSVDVMELNPERDKENKTAKLSAEIIIGLINKAPQSR